MSESTDRVRDAIFAELDRQNDAGEIGGAGHWDSAWGCLDGEPNWGKIAEAVVAVTRLDAEPEGPS